MPSEEAPTSISSRRLEHTTHKHNRDEHVGSKSAHIGRKLPKLGGNTTSFRRAPSPPSATHPESSRPKPFKKILPALPLDVPRPHTTATTSRSQPPNPSDHGDHGLTTRTPESAQKPPGSAEAPIPTWMTSSGAELPSFLKPQQLTPEQKLQRLQLEMERLQHTAKGSDDGQGGQDYSTICHQRAQKPQIMALLGMRMGRPQELNEGHAKRLLEVQKEKQRQKVHYKAALVAAHKVKEQDGGGGGGGNPFGLRLASLSAMHHQQPHEPVVTAGHAAIPGASLQAVRRHCDSALRDMVDRSKNMIKDPMRNMICNPGHEWP